VFLRVAPFSVQSGLDRGALMAAVGERLGRFFGKRGDAVLDANLALVGDAYDQLIDVTAGIGLRTGPTRTNQG